MAKSKETEKKENVDLTKVKEELKDYVDLQIKKGFTEELEKSNKRLIREKNKKIIFRNIVIIILLAVICFLVFLLYKAKFFNKLFIDDETKTNNVENEVITSDNNNEDEEISLDELIKNYSYLLDDIYINENSKYIEEYYNGKLTNELKSYLSLNNISDSDLTIEEDYNIIDEDKLKDVYNKMFNDYDAVSFDYNGNKIRYLSKINSYMSNELITKLGSNIRRDIINIKVSDNIVITTVEGLVIDSKLYNVTEETEIENYNDENLSKYENVLNKVVYTFKDGKLINIGKSE